MFSQTIKNEGYTLASMIRDELFYQGATFASCIVSHPQSYELDITIEGEEPNEILKSAVERSSLRLKACTQALDNFLSFSSLQEEMDVVEKEELLPQTKKETVRKSTRSKKSVVNESNAVEDKADNPQESGRRKRRTRHSDES